MYIVQLQTSVITTLQRGAKKWTTMQSVNITDVKCRSTMVSFSENVDTRDRIRSGDDKEGIFYAILFVLNILCEVIHDVINMITPDRVGTRTVLETTGFSYRSKGWT